MVRPSLFPALRIFHKLTLNSYAKLNLYLKVINRRPDHYHNISTIFERIDLCDRLTLKTCREKGIKIVCNSPDVPTDRTNLAYRSAEILMQALHIEKGVEIRIDKRIPVGAGLGGGSSNAACVLLGLNKLWGLRLSQEKLAGFAREIGSDVPFFIYNAAFAQGTSCGDRIKPLPQIKTRFWHLLVVPKIKVLTPFIYQKWDEQAKNLEIAGLTISPDNVKLIILALKQRRISLINKVLGNSLEGITSQIYPEVKHIKEKLLSFGLKTVSMSGSGPAVFALVSSRKEGLALARTLNREGRSWQVFVARTV